ncbi:ribonuclease H2 subunit B [Contarinia nasturtii]|uniref:ribonuclease H2 subunit B n=1 Tax=Contarinia nasturtii TaxID=265458 RepID=UPI0012D3D4D9|nr:ribonuclease H2 subunit B [Contarinia nasturtii]
MTTRSKGKSTQSDQNKIAAIQKHLNNRVFLLDASLIDKPSDGDIQIISLRNPSNEKSTKYLYAKEKQQFFELLSFSEEHRSWFANDTVYPDGNLYITSPFDPLFLALYYIRRNSSDRCQPIDQTIVDEDFTNTHLIADVMTVQQMSMIADQKGDASLKAFKYNESKALIWLSLKCEKLAKSLKESHFHIGAKSINYIKTEKVGNESQNDGEYLSYAYGIIGDYITLELCEKLSDKLGLEKMKPAMAGKRKSLIELENNTLKRIKSEENFATANMLETVSPSPPPPKEKKVSAKELKMAKAATGTKSISSFFMKK